MKRVFITGTGMTRFGELWRENVESLVQIAAGEALEEAECLIRDIDYLVVGNMLLQQLEQRALVGALVGESLGFAGPSIHIEAACASGGLAVRQGVMAIRSSMAKRVLVVGVEKMTDVPGSEISRALMAAGGEDEQWAGTTFPALYALMMKAYMRQYEVTIKEVAAEAVKNHEKGKLHPLAQFRKEITVEDVLASGLVADPIRQLMCAPISDGAAAIVLESEGDNRKIEIAGSGQGGDSLSLGKRKTFYTLPATKIAVAQALKEANLCIDKVDVAEVHDCFSIAQLMALKDLGLSEKTVVNTSGGLKSCGHPVGATGVKQAVEVARQLAGECGKRQVTEAKWGLTHNVGGTGAAAVVHILRRHNEN